MYRIVLAGNPNTGKSSLLNSLTGKDVKVGNWHGVTVERSDGEYTHEGKRYRVTDLPGLYTLRGSAAEEMVAENFLKGKDYDLIVLMAEAKNLRRSLRLLGELAEIGKPIVAFINFYGDFSSRGGYIDGEKLQEITGVNFFFGEANDKKDAERFKKFISALPPQNSKPRINASRIPDGVFRPATKRTKFDKLAENPLFCYPLFAVVIFAAFWLAFGRGGVGDAIGQVVSKFIELLKCSTRKVLAPRCSPFITDLVAEGLIGGVGAVAEFIPQIAVLSACMEFLEQSGYVSRLAVTTDGFLSKIGLNGKAVYTLLGGFGCTAVAATLAGGIEDPAVRRRTVLSLPFVSCSARTPVYALIAKFCFGALAPLVMTAIYILSIIFALVHSLLLYKTVVRIPPLPLILELADLRIPEFRLIAKALWRTVKHFVTRLGTVVVITSVVLFLLNGITPDIRYVAGGSENSLLSYIGRACGFLFRPMGIDDWAYSVAAIGGIFAKEGVASCLTMLFPDGLTLTAAQGVSYTLFCFIYTPCISALAAMGKAIGRKWALLSALWQLAAAFVLSYLAYFIMSVF